MASSNTIYYIVGAIVVIAIVGFVVAGGFAGGSTVAVQLTDPPSVPSGTQHLFVTYSSVQVHVSSTGSGSVNASNQSGWATAQGNGTVDLMALVNTSQTLASAHVAANSTVNLVRFSISSIAIVVNNNTYNVTTPNNELTVTVTGDQKINAGSAAVLIDLFPTVTARGGAGATTYMLVPAARAVILNAGTNVTVNTNVGGVANVSATARSRLGLNVG